MKFRPQRGALDDAMKEVFEFTTRQELANHLGVPAENLAVIDYVDAPDGRIGWERTCVVLDGQTPLGFTDGRILPENLAEARRRYANAAHAVQSGVASELGLVPDDSATSPKHLRVGLNSLFVENAAILDLLFKKGVLTELEWATALADGMEAEKKRYEERLAARLGHPVTLG